MNKNESADAILFCNGIPGAQWQLGRIHDAEGAFALIGWSSKDRDGAVPAAVVNTLSRALAKFGRVCFPCSEISVPRGSGWILRGADYATVIPLNAAHGWRSALKAVLNSSELVLLSTTREDALRTMFADPAYPWWLQGQFALLSRPSTNLPDLMPHFALLRDLIEPGWAGTLDELRGTGIEAIIRPGVDGSVAGMQCVSPEIRREIEEGISRAALDFGLTSRLLSEDAFALALSMDTGSGPVS